MSFSFNNLFSALSSTLEVSNDGEKYTIDESHSGRELVFQCMSPEDFQADSDDSVYALKLNDSSAGMVRFKVSKCSTVFFATIYTKTAYPHSGLVIENDFEVTVNGSTTTYKNGYLVAHAMFTRSGSTLSTRLLVCMCTTRNAAFNELAVVFKNAGTYTRAMSPGFVSSTACFQLVETLRKEIRKPFDQYWDKRLTEKVEPLGDGITNCAIFAGRIFYSLAPSQDCKDSAKEGIQKVFKSLNIEASAVSPYISALTN